MGKHRMALAALAALALAAWLPSCGSHAGSAGASAGRGSGRLNLRVAWPAAAQGRLIPQAANSISVSVYQNTTLVTTKPLTIVRPQTSYLLSGLPTGYIYIVATAYASSDGTGQPLATGRATDILITAGGTATAPVLTMATTVTAIAVTAGSSSLTVNQSTTLTATATDANGNTVLVAPSAWSWSTSSSDVLVMGSGSDNTATALGAVAGSATITATYTEPSPTISGTVALTVTGSGAVTQPWPKFHADSRNTGNGQGSGAAGSQLFTPYLCGNAINSSPAISTFGIVYFGCDDHTLYGVDAAAGTLRGSFTAPARLRSSPAIGADGTIWIGCDDKNVYAINPGSSTFTTRSKTLTGGTVRSSAAVGTDGTIYIGSDDGYLYALNGTTGAINWSYNVGPFNGLSNSTSPALAADGTIYFATPAGNLFAITSGGALKWESAALASAAFTASPVVGTDGTIYIGAGDSNLYVVNPSTGQATNTITMPDTVTATAALSSAGVLVVASGAWVTAFDTTNSENQLWQVQLNSNITGAPILGTDGTVYVGTANGRLYALNSSNNGATTWSVSCGGTLHDPAMGINGVVYCGSSNDNLYAIK
jgi:outer membrane protein assembly factor BamB